MSGLVIDSNLLCLLAVGLVDRDGISEHRRLKAFDGKDYDRVFAIVQRFNSVVVCPQVLAETSNLLRYTNPALAMKLLRALADIVERFHETHKPATAVTADPDYIRLGVTDAVLLLLTQENRALLSDDRDLCHAAAARGFNVINYNYVRDGALRLDQIAP